MKKRTLVYLLIIGMFLCISSTGIMAEEVEDAIEPTQLNTPEESSEPTITIEELENIPITLEEAELMMSVGEFENRLANFRNRYGYHHGATYRNGDFNLARECHGYARLLTREIFGVECMNGTAAGWSRHRDINRIQPGDLIRYRNDGHTIFVTGVSGDTVTFTDANYNSRNGIRWGATISKGEIARTLTYICHYDRDPVIIAPPDTEKPVLSNVRITGQNPNGYGVVVNVNDNKGVARVAFPTWIAGDSESQIVWRDGDISGNQAYIEISIARHGNRRGWYYTHIYAYDHDGNQSEALAVSVYLDGNPPTLSDIKITEVSSTGYTVECNVEDDSETINRVQFPTWTITNGQDDLKNEWNINPACSGVIEGNRVKYRVDISDFDYQRDHYITHIYAFDANGNYTTGGIEVDLKGKNEVVGSTKLNEKEYFLVDDAASWNEAKAKSETRGGHLATITSQEEENAIIELMKNGNQQHYFIGGNDRENEGTFKWITGEPMNYTFWANGEPNNFPNSREDGEAYMSIRRDGTWNDVFDAAYSGYIVEIQEPTVDKKVSVSYQTHVENIDWQNYVSNGSIGGTTNQALRLEGIKIKTDTEGLGIEYRTHVENIAWQNYVKNNDMSGTSGKALRLEAINIRLTGEKAKFYDVYYRVHTENIGWMGWAKNDKPSGTEGHAYRLEGIQILIVPKGDPQPNIGPPSDVREAFIGK